MVKKQSPNHNKPWTPTQDRQLRELARGNTPTGLLAYKLGRTEDAVRAHASDIGLSLQPPNRSPYTRRKR
jgi:hypothetical protein